MNENEALRAVARMFHAHGRTPGPEVVAEYADAVLEANCAACMSEVLVQVRREGMKVPPVSGLWSLYYERNRSPSHFDHIGQADREVSVGKQEAEWHRYAVADLQAILKDREQAELLAARMWASGCVEPHGVKAELEAPVWLATQPEPTPARIAAYWAFARALATTPPEEMSDEQWAALVAAMEAA
jgi:hypothetical protein